MPVDELSDPVVGRAALSDCCFLCPEHTSALFAIGFDGTRFLDRSQLLQTDNEIRRSKEDRYGEPFALGKARVGESKQEAALTDTPAGYLIPANSLSKAPAA
jgi:hypothetical protein